jgi:hypothetical protein
MNNRVISTLSIAAVSVLLIGLTLATPAKANLFSCRASPLRVVQPNDGVFEPIVANPADVPCQTDDKSFPSVSLLNIVTAEGLDADTVGAAPHAGLPNTAEAKVVELSLLGGVVTAGVVNATAKVTPVNGVCQFSSSSSVATLAIGGVPVTVGSTPLNLPIPLVGVLHLNETIKGTNPAAPSVTQRALDLEITSPLLQMTLNLKRVVVAEAIADVAAENPCSVP